MQQNKKKKIKLALRYHDDIFQKGRLEVADEISYRLILLYIIQFYRRYYGMVLKEQRNMHLPL